MSFPDFFANAPTITLYDGLAELLGAATDGLMTYHYKDAVKLAGHSCPTVAGAYLMARAAIKALYPDDTMPVRGGMAVRMVAAEAQGVTGVIAQVFTLITGAAANNGFHGIGGAHVRQGLLAYDGKEGGSGVRVRRLDNSATVGVTLDLSSIPPHPDMQANIAAVLQGNATDEQRQAFADGWQDRVRRLLLEHADDPAVVVLTHL
jgi:hypothetical protein